MKLSLSLKKSALITVLLAITACSDTDSSTTSGKPSNNKLPNVVVILADDMGYGDVKAYNPEMKFDTPAIDAIANRGIRFTDGHSNAAVCTPTRYGLLTGQYSWRSRLKQWVLWGYSRNLIEESQFTLPKLFKQAGYNTAAIGKWHLGMQLDMGEKTGSYEYDDYAMVGDKKGVASVNWHGDIEQSPNKIGFDYFYGISASLDMPPYAYIENSKVVEQPDHWIEKKNFPIAVRAGEKAQNFNFVDVGYEFANRSAAYINEHASDDKPFFLYVPMSAPHKPVITSAEFKGKTGLGEYADFVALTDFWVSKVTGALKENGIYDNTIIIFTSDNGSFMSTINGVDKDHTTEPSIAAYNASNHTPNGIYRGTKSNAYEGGHRVPFIVSWPAKLAQGATQDTAIVTSDILPTLVSLLALETPENVSFDGVSLSNALTSMEKQNREAFIINAGNGILAIRDGDWKLIMGNGSGGFENKYSNDKKGEAFTGPYQLFNLANDPSESRDLLTKMYSSEESKAMAKALEAKALVIIGDSLNNARAVL